MRAALMTLPFFLFRTRLRMRSTDASTNTSKLRAHVEYESYLENTRVIFGQESPGSCAEDFN